MRPLLTEEELERLESAVRSAERGSTAEIVVVIAGGPAEGHGWLYWPMVVALAAPSVLIWLGLTARTLYVTQLAVLMLGALPWFLPALRRMLTPVASRHAAARRLAREQFFELGLHLTAARTGILLLVLPDDRCAELVADAGAQGPLPDEAWRPCVAALLTEAQRGRLSAGIEAALAELGAVLRERIPAGTTDRNELPDRPVLLGPHSI